MRLATIYDEYAGYIDDMDFSQQEIGEMIRVLSVEIARQEYINKRASKSLRSLKPKRIWGVR
jgi:hypothetical protein